MKADEGGGGPGEPVTGTFEVPRGTKVSPHQGFDNAFNAALERLGWEPGEHGATIQFSARITVTNPGEVGEYRVTIIPT
jgi:hypothetical protein